MEFKDMQQLWVNHPAAETDQLGWDAVAARVRTLHRRLVVRDAMEMSVALGMTLLFGWVALRAPVAWPWVAASLLTLGLAAVFIRERVRAARRAAATTDLRHGLEQAIEEVEHQMRLLGSVGAWYLAPSAGVVVLVLVGTALGARAAVEPEVWARASGDLYRAMAWFVPLIVAAFAVVWWLNRRTVTTRLVPHREYLRQALRQLTDADDDGQSSSGVTPQLTPPAGSVR